MAGKHRGPRVVKGHSTVLARVTLQESNERAIRMMMLAEQRSYANAVSVLVGEALQARARKRLKQ